MGTLTGDTSALAEHCPHKLPTSCRLTATPLCCACQDKRPHSSLYSVYVDGIGMVMRGVRWQRYCWFCKEFWTNRVAATNPPLDAQHTRIPDEPDQSDFLRKWFDYHRGYRIEQREAHGASDKVELCCETPWRDVAPGHLPVVDDAERRVIQQVAPAHRDADAGQEPSIDATLDELLAGADVEGENAPPPPPSQPSHPQPATHTSTSDRRDELNQILHIAEEHKERCAERKHAAHRDLQEAEQALRSVRGRLEQIAREEANAARMARVFGTREEMASAEWVSPLATMFGRAYERYAVAEELRAEEARSTTGGTTGGAAAAAAHPRNAIMLDADAAVPDTAGMREQVRAWERAAAAQAHDGTPIAAGTGTGMGIGIGISAEEVALVQNFEQNFRLMQAYPGGADGFLAGMGVRRADEAPARTLDDGADERPPPQSEAEMTVRLACRICLQQRADTAVLPCGHLVMCSFCADIWMPTRKEDRTQPARAAQCPLCRRNVKRRVRIFIS